MVVLWRRIPAVFFIFLGITNFSVSAQTSEPLTVLTSWSILEDVVQNVGKSHVQVRSLAPRGIDLHDFKLTPGDQIRLRKADWLVWLGLNLEPWLAPSLQRIAQEKQLQVGAHLTNLLAIHAGSKRRDVNHKEKDADHDSSGRVDPHIWHDIRMMIQVSQIVAEGLAKQDPKHASMYRQNAADYIQKLKKLDQWVHQELAFIPPSQRLLVTSHQAFEYFGRAYHFQTLAPRGLNTANQPSPKLLERIMTTLQEKQVKVIFQEAHINASLLKQIANETNIVIKKELLTGNLAKQGQAGATYHGFIKSNVSRIAEAFKSYLSE